MTVLKPARLLGTLAVLATIPLLSAVAQTQSPGSADTAAPPAVTKPEATMPPAQKQASPPSLPDKTATAGLAVISSDGSKLGAVQSVATGPDGKVSAIRLKVGGFLSFGGKIVAIPASKFTRSGDTINLSMTADEVSKLPEAKELN